MVGGGGGVPPPPLLSVSAPSPTSSSAAPTTSPPPPQQGSAPQGTASPLPSEEEGSTPTRDLTKVPSQLDSAYETHDSDSSLRASIITASGPWVKRSQASLLSKPTDATLEAEEQGRAKHAAFDLLDALTRSGALPMEHAALHVIMGATHRFEQSLMDTVVKGNVNPIEKAERSLLIMASTLHSLPAASLINRDRLDRLAAVTPTLFAVEDAPK